jgi:hypothetical protein
MDENYRGHLIRYEAKPSADGWRPVIQVCWNENGATKMRLWIDFRHTFTSKREATEEGRVLAKRWVDEGKPNLNGYSHH